MLSQMYTTKEHKIEQWEKSRGWDNNKKGSRENKINSYVDYSSVSLASTFIG